MDACNGPRGKPDVEGRPLIGAKARPANAHGPLAVT
jgi:hypothetical protein